MDKACLLNVPGSRMERTLGRVILPALTVHGGGSLRSARTFLGIRLDLNGLPRTVGYLGTLVTSIPCDGGGLTDVSVRRHCHLVVDAVFGTVNYQIRMRGVVTANEVSVIMRMAGFVCMLRLGLDGGKNMSTTRRRVGTGRCTRPFGTSGEGMVTLTVRLSSVKGKLIS